MLALVDHAIGILYPSAAASQRQRSWQSIVFLGNAQPQAESKQRHQYRQDHIFIQSCFTDPGYRRPIRKIIQSLFCRLLAHSQSENAMKPITAGATKIGAGTGRHNQTTIATVIRRKK